MRRAIRVGVGALAVVGATAIVLSVVAQFAIDCTTQRISGAASPTRKIVAEHYQTTCQSDSVPRSQIQIVHDGTRVGTEIGVATTSAIGLAWRDDSSLVITVPPGMDGAFDRTLEGIKLEFRVVPDPTDPTSN